jgi:hypothetical protein
MIDLSALNLCCPIIEQIAHIINSVEGKSTVKNRNFRGYGVATAPPGFEAG